MGSSLIIVLYSPKYSPNLYNSNNIGYHIEAGVNYENINLGDVSINKNIVLKPDGLIVSNSVDNNSFGYNYDFSNNILTNSNPVSNGVVVLTSPNSYNNINSYTNSSFNSTMLPLNSNENEVSNNISNTLFSQELSSTKLMRNNGHGHGIEDNNGDDHGNGHGWGRDGNEGNGNGNGGNNLPLNDDLFPLLMISMVYIVLKKLKIVK